MVFLLDSTDFLAAPDWLRDAWPPGVSATKTWSVEEVSDRVPPELRAALETFLRERQQVRRQSEAERAEASRQRREAERVARQREQELRGGQSFFA